VNGGLICIPGSHLSRIEPDLPSLLHIPAGCLIIWNSMLSISERAPTLEGKQLNFYVSMSKGEKFSRALDLRRLMKFSHGATTLSGFANEDLREDVSKERNLDAFSKKKLPSVLFSRIRPLICKPTYQSWLVLKNSKIVFVAPCKMISNYLSPVFISLVRNLQSIGVRVFLCVPIRSRGYWKFTLKRKMRQRYCSKFVWPKIMYHRQIIDRRQFDLMFRLDSRFQKSRVDHQVDVMVSSFAQALIRQRVNKTFH